MWLLYVGALILLLQVIAFFKDLKNGEDTIGKARRDLERVGRQLKILPLDQVKRFSKKVSGSKGDRKKRWDTM